MRGDVRAGAGGGHRGGGRGRRCSGPGGGCAGSARCAAPRRASAATGRSRWSRRRGGSSAGAAARAATWSTSSWRSGAGRCARRRCGCAGWRWRPTRPLRLGLAADPPPPLRRGGAGRSGWRHPGAIRADGRYLSGCVAGYLRARGISRAWAAAGPACGSRTGRLLWGATRPMAWIRRRRWSAGGDAVGADRRGACDLPAGDGRRRRRGWTRRSGCGGRSGTREGRPGGVWLSPMRARRAR
jgi:hypothetical protein